MERVQWILDPALLCDPKHVTSLWASDAPSVRNTKQGPSASVIGGVVPAARSSALLGRWL